MFSAGHKYETLLSLCVIVLEPPVVQQTPIVIWIENWDQMAFSIFKETLYGNPSQCSLSISELTPVTNTSTIWQFQYWPSVVLIGDRIQLASQNFFTVIETTWMNEWMNEWMFFFVQGPPPFLL